MKTYRNVFLIIFAMIFVTGMSVAYKTDSHNILQVRYNALTSDAKKEVQCLADNIYHEAGYEEEDGKVAVGLVTMNRVQDPRFPKDICGVVKQKTLAQGLTVCQFSWFCNKPNVNRQSDAYQDSLEAAMRVYVNYEILEDITKGAIYYHADYINPQWKLKKTTKIGRHIFYKDYYNDAKAESATKRRSI